MAKPVLEFVIGTYYVVTLSFADPLPPKEGRKVYVYTCKHGLGNEEKVFYATKRLMLLIQGIKPSAGMKIRIYRSGEDEWEVTSDAATIVTRRRDDEPQIVEDTDADIDAAVRLFERILRRLF